MVIDPNDDQTFHRVLRTMEAYGGSFAAKLAEAGYAADMTNRARLVYAFDDLFDRYGPTSYFFEDVLRRETEADLHPDRRWSFSTLRTFDRRYSVGVTPEGKLLVTFQPGQTNYETVNCAGTLICEPAMPGSSDSMTFTMAGKRWVDCGLWTPAEEA